MKLPHPKRIVIAYLIFVIALAVFAAVPIFREGDRTGIFLMGFLIGSLSIMLMVILHQTE